MRVAPQHWIDMLGDWAKPHDQLAHVEIWFDEEVERWVLVECVPPQHLSDDLRLELLTYPDKTPFRRRQSAYYKEHGKIPLAFWIIQGEQGGHKLEYATHEAEIAQWYGGSREPPAPGSLPYAPFDGRVVDALRGFDRAMSEFRTLSQAFEGNAQAALEKMRIDVLLRSRAQLTDAIDEAANDIMQADIPTMDGPPPDYDAEDDRYIKTGLMDAPGGSMRAAGSATKVLPL